MSQSYPRTFRSKAFSYHLTILNQPGDRAFTTIAGNICIPQPLVKSLLADTKRGKAALAFVLADQIAHVGLGQCGDMTEERDAVAEAASFLPFRLPEALEGAATDRLRFTNAEREDADLFALHLCRNAGFDLDAALDSVRREADGANRLKRLVMERDGLFDDPLRYGLFLFDRHSGKLTRCGSQQIGPDERPIILVHGLRGNKWALGDYLWFFRDRPEFADRPLLVFRYPNNESLSRCGQFMTREMRRVVVEPEQGRFRLSQPAAWSFAGTRRCDAAASIRRSFSPCRTPERAWPNSRESWTWADSSSICPSAMTMR